MITLADLAESLQPVSDAASDTASDAANDAAMHTIMRLGPTEPVVGFSHEATLHSALNPVQATYRYTHSTEHAHTFTGTVPQGMKSKSLNALAVECAACSLSCMPPIP